MEKNKMFCADCGAKMDREAKFCPSCGAKNETLENPIKKEEGLEVKEPNNQNEVVLTPSSESKSSKQKSGKFYTKNWFLWLSLIVFAPLGIFLLWKFHPEKKKKTKIIITIIFAIIFIFVIIPSDDDEYDYSSDYTVVDEEVELEEEEESEVGEEDEDYSFESDDDSDTTEGTVLEEETTTEKTSDVSYKEFWDSYEAFYDSYIAFMETYDASDPSALAKYAQLMAQYADFAEKADARENEEMSDEEAAYALEVETRVANKLAQASLS